MDYTLVTILPSRIHQEIVSVVRVVDGSDGPGYTDAEEDIHSITSGHISHTGISVLVLDGGHLTRECIWEEVDNNIILCIV